MPCSNPVRGLCTVDVLGGPDLRGAARVRIEASHDDGWTQHLLRWKLEIRDGLADLEADWSGNPSPLRARFRFDEGPIRSALPLISGMNEDYRAPVEDQETRVLLIEDGERSIRRHVYGAGFLVKAHPEVKGFLKLWRLLDRAVEGSLPAHVRS